MATGTSILAVVWMQGWVGRILAVDDTHICKLIFALFVVGLVWTGQRVLMLSRELNALERWPLGAERARRRSCARCAGRDGHVRAALVGALRLKLIHRIAPVRHMASTLVLLGLIGTIIGFIIALVGRRSDGGDRRGGDRPDGRDTAARHGDGAVQDPGRLGPQCLADGQLPPAREPAPRTC